MLKRLLIPLAVAAALVAAAMLAAGCGGSASASGGSSSTSSSGSGGYGYGGGSVSQAPSQPASGPATIAVRTTPLGRILVDGKGMTLYLFEKDTGTTSTCSGACATFWPPTTTMGAPKAGTGVDASKLGTTMRGDGTTEVTYNGHPLYYYKGDQSPGDTNGQGQNVYGALWYVVSPAGEEVVG